MSKFAIDLRTGRLTADVHEGTMGFISWRRLFDEALRSSGEIHPDEKVVVVEASERGLQFCVTKNDK